MRDTRRNILVGLFVLVGFGAIGTLIVLFGQSPEWMMRRPEYVLNLHFNAATGIRAGTLVTVGGIEVGRVRNVGFKNPEQFSEGAIVTVALDTGYRLRAGATARTSEPGLGMGRPPIELVPAPDRAAPYLESGAVIPGRLAPAVESLFPPTIVETLETTARQIGEAAVALRPVLDDLRIIVTPLRTDEVDVPGGAQGNLSTAVARLDELLANLNVVISDPKMRESLRSSVTNFERMSEDGRLLAADLRAASSDTRQIVNDVRGLVGATRGTVDNLNAQANRISEATVDNLNSISGILRDVSEVTAMIRRGEGNLGRFLYDAELYESMVLTFRRLAEAVDQFRILVEEWQKGRIRIAL